MKDEFEYTPVGFSYAYSFLVKNSQYKREELDRMDGFTLVHAANVLFRNLEDERKVH